MSSSDSCVRSSSQARDVEITKQPFCLYLFYDHSDNPNAMWCYGLYKFVVNLNEPTTYNEDPPSPILMEFPTRDYDEDSVVNPSPIFEIPKRNYIPTKGMRLAPSPLLVFPRRNLLAPIGMRCARLGSKLYFLGGTVEERFCDEREYPRDVFVFDIATEQIKLMDVRLDAGKPMPCAVFAANGKLYALGRLPYFPHISRSELSDKISEMKLFECYDPTTNRWEVLDNLPSVYLDSNYVGIAWEGCNVLEKRQQVVLIGRPFPISYEMKVKFVYHFQQDEWTCHRLPVPKIDALAAISFQEAADDNAYLYSLPREIAQPLKSKSDYISEEDEDALFSDVFPPNWYCMDEQDEPDEEDAPPVVVDGLVEMSSPDMSKRELYIMFRGKLRQPYPYPYITRLLRYAGHGYFCYLTCGKLCRNNRPLRGDTRTQGITITLLKEEIKQEKQDCFLAQILHSQIYVMETPFHLAGELEGCFVVTPEQLQRRLNRKEKKKKKKNVLQ